MMPGLKMMINPLPSVGGFVMFILLFSFIASRVVHRLTQLLLLATALAGECYTITGCEQDGQRVE